MKKLFLYFLATCITAVTVSQLVSNNNANSTNNSKVEELLELDKNDDIITKLDQEYHSRTDQLNYKIEKNLVANITLINNEITINYQNLNRELYSEPIYQAILSSEYLDNLKTQYQLNLISFDVNHHINFDNNKISNYSSNVWGEWHWYWFAWWKLHLSHNAIMTVINTFYKFGGTSGGMIVKISQKITELLSTGIAMTSAIIVSGFIIVSFVVLLGYSNNVKGCWIGMLSLLPGVTWGSN